MTPEQFADPLLREAWRREKDMTVLPLWSDARHRTQVAVFAYELFDFSEEYKLARREQLSGAVPLEVLQPLPARPQDMADIADLFLK